MSAPLDIHILPIDPADGENKAAPALLTASPPRRSARVRKHDRILITIHYQGTAKFPENQQQEMLEQLAEGYFRSKGTVTAAMRDMAVSVNDLLWNRNKRSSAHGQTVTAVLSLMVFREGSVYLMQSSPASVQHFSQQKMETFRERNLSMHGLGSTQVPKIQFFQTKLEAGDVLLYALKQPEDWSSESLGSLFGKPMRNTYQKLLSGVSNDPGALLISVRTGLGEINLIQKKPAAIAPQKATVTKPPATTRPGYVPPFVADDIPPLEKLGEEVSMPPEDSSPDKLEPEYAEPESAPVVSAAPIKPAPVVESPSVPKQPIIEVIREKVSGLWRSFLLKLRDGVRFLGRTSEKINGFARRILPGDGLLQIPGSFMAVAAIVVPLVVVAIALFFYFNVGYNRQYQYNMTEALKAAEQAEAETDYEEIRYQWEYARSFADKAEEYKITEDSKGLQVYITSNLDILDGINRLAFQPIVTGELGEDLQIVKIITSGKDVYALDGKSGNILRIFKTATGYEQDPDFACSSNSMEIDKLVDISPVEFIDNTNPAIMALDSSGKLLLCYPAGPSRIIYLATPSGAGWQAPSQIATFENYLYVLDAPANAIWLYTKHGRYEASLPDTLFPDAPHFYFGITDKRPSVNDVLDFSIDREPLYLLKNDGTVVSCYFSGYDVGQTVCEDSPFVDTRPGKANQPFVTSAHFSMIFRTAAPEPSVFFADFNTNAVFQFTKQLTFVRQVLPLEPLSETNLTAFTVSSERRLFTAYGNQIFYTNLP